MSREDAIRIEGTVIEVLPNQMVRVEFVNGHRILARRSGKMRLSFTRLSPADKVAVEMSPYDLSKGAIVERVNEMKS
ncbi:MAG: translation initiation factor IF-1 [Planctomycetaceae bacterium]|nr:MAG: translation initiation factor IF-1 [Planctomycetaceae bacterium]